MVGVKRREISGESGGAEGARRSVSEDFEGALEAPSSRVSARQRHCFFLPHLHRLRRRHRQ